MEADWSVALGADDPVVVVPWEAPEGASRYVDLRQNSKLIRAVGEARDNKTLHDALLTLNSADSPLWTAKCDFWESNEACDPYEMHAEPDEAAFLAGSYIDLLPADESLGESFASHEQWLRVWTERLRAQDCNACRVDLVLRAAQVNGRAGYAVSWFVQGCGATPDLARLSWSTALVISLEAILYSLQTGTDGTVQ